MTEEEKEQKENPLTKKNLELESQLSQLLNMNSMKDESFYRIQVLMMLERISTAIEKLGFSEEESPKKE